MAQKRLAPGAWEAFYNRVRWAVREMTLANPALDFNELLFVRRHWPSWGHQCSHRVGEAQVVGADLCVLTGLDGGGTGRSVLGKQLAPGGIGELRLRGEQVCRGYLDPSLDVDAFDVRELTARDGTTDVACDGDGHRRPAVLLALTRSRYGLAKFRVAMVSQVSPPSGVSCQS